MILVTGGTGHLGANLVRRLVADGHQVRVLVRDTGAAQGALDGLPVQKVIGDVRDRASVSAAVDGCNRVFHCAARVSTSARGHRGIYDVNVTGTRHVLEAAWHSGVQRVVVTGSFSATGNPLGRPSTEDDPHYPFEEHTPYTRSKVLVEHECHRAASQGLDVVVAVSTAIVGPHDYRPSRMGRLLLDFAHGRLLAYIPGGFEFVSTQDLVEGHLLAMAHGRPGGKYLLSTEFRTVDQMLDLYSEATGRPKPRLRVPAPMMHGLARFMDAPRAVLAPHREPRFTPAAVGFLRSQRRADCSRSRTQLGFRPGDIAQAVEQAYRCFVDRGLVERARRSQPAPAGRGTAWSVR
ncbi:NAD-dependent epimerase/dehydratase family protein [Streptomyces sp. G44]|uniref:NAD-dependent epimerase/dehydratase family protein n=1 Tax=Streptomyces sp. G44 TaxID=2807632 RepID=UPI001961F790|nr:NAD-dependent epimerase/dehydratase family protein [Streptomyces sp. G44]MBM7166862.1 NAD-dependent epimerase/dehydratase family protein [Streptomyces sp. G44]